MLPRPSRVFQDPGLRLIGRSPGVPDKSSRGLGSMSWHSAQILICFIAYIFQFLKSSVGGVGALQIWNGPVALQHYYCYQNEAPAKYNEISQHPLLGGKALGFYWDDHIGRIVMELVKLTDNIAKIHNDVKIINPGIKWRESLFVFVSTLTTFHSISQSHANSFSATRSQQNGLMHSSLSNLSFKVFQTVRDEDCEIGGWNDDFGPKLHNLWSQCSSSSVWFLQVGTWNLYAEISC